MQFDASLFAPVVRDTFARIRASSSVFGSIYLAATLAGVGYDLSMEILGDAALLYYVAFMFFMLFLQACGTIAILEGGGVALASPRRWRIASLFGISLLVGLGITFGLLLLILPGLFFAGRWYLAAPILFGEDLSVSEAMSESWDRTEQYWLSITIIAIVALVWQVGPLAASLFVAPGGDPASWLAILAVNAVSQAGWLFGVAAASTAYLAFGGRGGRTQQIFS